jgi:hypothetical protein
MPYLSESKSRKSKSSQKITTITIPMWKWEELGMDFITGLPITKNQKDMI